MSVHVCVSLSVCVSEYLCVCAYVCVRAYVCMRARACVCVVCVNVHACVGVRGEQKKVGFPGAGVTYSCELLTVGTKFLSFGRGTNTPKHFSVTLVF